MKEALFLLSAETESQVRRDHRANDISKRNNGPRIAGCSALIIE
jgi:hypothetical protein